ncbi:MAG: VOC family protein [Sphingobacteriia bacterium]|nr:VOC family protein [Sphingobacteriia bacterium]
MRLPIFFFCLLFGFAAKAQKAPRASINHIALSVVDMKKSNFFYMDIIGLDTIPEPFHDGIHTWYSIGPKTALHIIEGAKQVKTYYKGSHLCFTVASVDRQLETLKRHKIHWEDWLGNPFGVTLRVDGVKQIWLQDPDGYWVEINDAKE